VALTQTPWTSKTVNGFAILACEVTPTTAETDAYTLPTPADKLDGTKPFTVYHSAAATPDGAALPVDVWVGYDDSFVLSGQGANVVANNGAFYKQLNDDCVLAVGNKKYAYYINPDLGVADVVTVAAIATGYKANVPGAPYYAFNLNGASTLAATKTTWVVVQKQY
jgi:hypothetical protein